MLAFSMVTTFKGKTWKTIQNRGLLKLLSDVCFSRATTFEVLLLFEVDREGNGNDPFVQ